MNAGVNPPPGAAESHTMSAATAIKAPWTPEQVKQLNRYQASGMVHPFTCPNHPTANVLVATKAGWTCPTCNYTQDWASALMASREFIDDLNRFRDGLLAKASGETLGILEQTLDATRKGQVNLVQGERANPQLPSIKCPRCGKTSHNPNDIREGYCGHCHDWTTKR